MLLKPFANTGDGTFIGVGRRMRPMKHPHFAKQHNRYTAAFSLYDLCTKFLKQAFNVAPLNVGTCWSGEYELQSASVLSLHVEMVPIFGTLFKLAAFLQLAARRRVNQETTSGRLAGVAQDVHAAPRGQGGQALASRLNDLSVRNAAPGTTRTPFGASRDAGGRR